MTTSTVTQAVASQALPSSTGSLYTVTATSFIVKEVLLCNSDSASAWTATLYMGGATAATGHILLNALTLNAKETKWITYSTVLTTNDQIFGVASGANTINITISGVKVA